MTTFLKHTLNPGFALLFAVGADRLYKIVDHVLDKTDPTPLLSPTFYVPLTMVLLTLVFGSLSSIANDKFMEARERVSATSLIAWFSYGSILCSLSMLYVAVKLTYAPYWWLGYAALCLVNAAWNGFAVRFPYFMPHVGVNLGVALLLLVLFLRQPSILSNPLWFYVLLAAIVFAKFLQRRQPREFAARQTPMARPEIPLRTGRVLKIAHGINTLERVSKAIEQKVEAIEVDVQITNDRKPVLFHDRELPETRNRIRDLSYDQLRESQPCMPLLADVLKDSHAAGIQVLLDIKDRDAINFVMEKIKETNALGNSRIACFDYWPLVRAKEICADISTVLTMGISRTMFTPRGSLWSVFSLGFPLLATRLRGADVILCPAWRLRSNLLRRAHRMGIFVYVWRASAGIEDTVDGLVTDLPVDIHPQGGI